MASGLVAFSLLALAAHAHADVRNVGAFTGVELRGLMEVDVEIGGAASVDVQGDPALAKLVLVSVKGGTLVIDTPKDFGTKLKSKRDHDLKVVVRLPALTKVMITGTGEMEVEGIAGKQLDATIAGTGELELEGKIDLLRLSVQGTGQVKAKGLVATAVELSIPGTAQATVHASKSFTADVQGTAAVKVFGKPATVKKTVVGTAAIDID